MHRLFWRSLKRHIVDNKSVSAMLFLGVFVAAFCVCIVLGYAAGEYYSLTKDCQYATVTIVPDEAMASDIQNFPQKMEELFGDSVYNTLYISRETETDVLIGWDGVEAVKWFPITSGRFFTEEEQEAGAKVAFVSYEYIEDSDASITLFGGEIYSVVGTGWIAEFNIRQGATENTVTKLFSGTGETLFKIIPYRAYLANAVPAVILVHFDRATRSELENRAAVIQAAFPGAFVGLPQKDSDEAYIEQNVLGTVKAVQLGVLACLTIVQLMAQWVEFYRKELSVYRVCGMTRRTCLLLLWGHWAIVFAAASAAAVAAHSLCGPLLEKIYAEYTPAFPFLALTLLILYAITALISAVKVRQTLRISDKGGLQ